MNFYANILEGAIKISKETYEFIDKLTEIMSNTIDELKKDRFFYKKSSDTFNLFDEVLEEFTRRVNIDTRNELPLREGFRFSLTTIASKDRFTASASVINLESKNLKRINMTLKVPKGNFNNYIETLEYVIQKKPSIIKTSLVHEFTHISEDLKRVDKGEDVSPFNPLPRKNLYVKYPDRWIELYTTIPGEIQAFAMQTGTYIFNEIKDNSKDNEEIIKKINKTIRTLPSVLLELSQRERETEEIYPSNIRAVKEIIKVSKMGLVKLKNKDGKTFKAFNGEDAYKKFTSYVIDFLLDKIKELQLY